MSLEPLAIIFMGSKGDSKHCEDIVNELNKYGIESVTRISSAHKTPGRILELLERYESDPRPKVYITVAGRSNALSGFADAAVTSPVISCPPEPKAFSGADIYSSIRMPSGVAPMLVLDPSGAALATAKIFGLLNQRIRDTIKRIQTENAQTLYIDDATMKTYGYSKKIAQERLHTLQTTDLKSLNPSAIYNGKVRDRYTIKDKVILITTDRISAFDRILTTIPYKGQVLNLTSAWWFKQTQHIIPNHMISVPCGHVMIAKKCTPFPIEFVVRGYIAGSTSTSLWVNYEKGVRKYCGIDLPEGLIKNQKLWENLITPTTKDDTHDELISPKEIVERNFMKKEDYEYCAEKALQLFAFGQQVASKHGLILVDTKYEFGKTDDGQILLIDEIHTPDSSRYWLANTYSARMRDGKSPDNIDKEFVREWYKAHCDPYKDETLPTAPDDIRDELSRKYLQLYEMITGEDFDFELGKVSHSSSLDTLLKSNI